jgi:hypothetical protein
MYICDLNHECKKGTVGGRGNRGKDGEVKERVTGGLLYACMKIA